MPPQDGTVPSAACLTMREYVPGGGRQGGRVGQQRWRCAAACARMGELGAHDHRGIEGHTPALPFMEHLAPSPRPQAPSPRARGALCPTQRTQEGSGQATWPTG